MKCKKCGVEIPFDQDVCSRCYDDGRNIDKRFTKAKVIRYSVILLIIILITSLFIMSLSKNREGDINILKVKDVYITKGTYSMILIETALSFRNEYITQKSVDDMTEKEKEEYLKLLDNFWNQKIDGKDPFEIVKERAMDQVRSFAYYQIKAREKGIKMTDEQRQGLETLMEAALVSQGVTIDAEDPDKVYLDLFGVTRKQYMDYRVAQSIAEEIFNDESNEMPVTQSEIEGQFEHERYMYASNTVDTIFLALKDDKGNPVSSEVKENKKKLAEEIKSKIESGDKFEQLVDKYSEVAGKDLNKGRYIINKDSVASQIFGDEFIEWVLYANPGDIKIVESEEGFSIAKCIEVGGLEESIEIIRRDVKQLKYYDVMEKRIMSDDYNPQIINESVYNKIKKVPGNILY